jgi:hypothetical protein
MTARSVGPAQLMRGRSWGGQAMSVHWGKADINPTGRRVCF